MGSDPTLGLPQLEPDWPLRGRVVALLGPRGAASAARSREGGSGRPGDYPSSVNPCGIWRCRSGTPIPRSSPSVTECGVVWSNVRWELARYTASSRGSRALAVARHPPTAARLHVWTPSADPSPRSALQPWPPRTPRRYCSVSPDSTHHGRCTTCTAFQSSESLTPSPTPSASSWTTCEPRPRTITNRAPSCPTRTRGAEPDGKDHGDRPSRAGLDRPPTASPEPVPPSSRRIPPELGARQERARDAAPRQNDGRRSGSPSSRGFAGGPVERQPRMATRQLPGPHITALTERPIMRIP